MPAGSQWENRIAKQRNMKLLISARIAALPNAVTHVDFRDPSIDEPNKVIAQLFEASATMQSALDKKDMEIKRLKEGYDTELIRRFVGRFLRVKGAITDARSSHDTIDINTINQIGRLLEDALDECDHPVRGLCV